MSLHDLSHLLLFIAVSHYMDILCSIHSFTSWWVFELFSLYKLIKRSLQIFVCACLLFHLGRYQNVGLLRVGLKSTITNLHLTIYFLFCPCVSSSFTPSSVLILNPFGVIIFSIQFCPDCWFDNSMNSMKRQKYSNRKQTSGCQKLEGQEEEWPQKGEPFGQCWSWLQLDCGEDFTTVYICQDLLNCAFKIVPQ